MPHDDIYPVFFCTPIFPPFFLSRSPRNVGSKTPTCLQCLLDIFGSHDIPINHFSFHHKLWLSTEQSTRGDEVYPFSLRNPAEQFVFHPTGFPSLAALETSNTSDIFLYSNLSACLKFCLFLCFLSSFTGKLKQTSLFGIFASYD